jgi:hypothetical protein
MSALFFPLRTSVELFGDATTPAIVTRAKEAAVLYDNLIFEDGVYTVEVLDTGSTDNWEPRARMTADLLETTRQPIPPGTEISLAMGKQPARGVPATEMVQMLRGHVEVAYATQFETGILDELRQFAPEWVATVETGGSNLDPNTLGEVAGRLRFEYSRDTELLPGVNEFYRSWLVNTFTRDAVLAAHLDASFGITGLFAPIAERARGVLGIAPELTGAEALAIQVPNIGALPWEAVVQFREHAGSQEARAKLREFEQRAASDTDPGDAYEFLKRVSAEVNLAYQAAVDDMRDSLTEALTKEVAKTGVSFIPVVGPFLGYGASVAELGLDVLKERKSWIAALMQLNESQPR